MAEHEPEQSEACDVCGRTILRGERTAAYATPDGERRRVCALCRERAEEAGWVPADSEAARALASAPQRRRGFKLRERVREYTGRLHPAEHPEEAGGEARAASPPRPTPSRAASKRRRPDPKPEANPVPIEPNTPERRVRRALDEFNRSDQARVVAGLIRSLGEPQAAVRDVSAKPPRVDVIVAWELSWYRWEVGLNGGGHVREVAKGAEVSELEGDEPDWNARVDAEGRIRWRERS
jgi:predicted Fe-S protein YdhL (DUF1289 family)